MENIEDIYKKALAVDEAGDDVEQVFELLHKCALQNHPAAMLMLGQKYLGVDNPEEAVYFIRRASEFGSIQANAALADLATLDASGKTVGQDEITKEMIETINEAYEVVDPEFWQDAFNYVINQCDVYEAGDLLTDIEVQNILDCYQTIIDDDLLEED